MCRCGHRTNAGHDPRRPRNETNPGEGLEKLRDHKRLDLAVVVGLLVIGFVLGQFQTVGRDRGRSDPVTRVVQALVSPPATVVRTSLAYLEDLFKGVRDAGKLRTENARLTAELLAMERYQETVDRLRAHIEELRGMNDYIPPPDRKKVYANIIGSFPDQNAIVIDRGSDDGLRKFMPVIAAKGLVGIIEVADPRRSRVLLISSRSIRVSAETVGEPSVTGILHGETTTRLAMEPLDAGDIVAGAHVVTSGFSELIPEGIPIGIVVEAIDDPQFGTKRVFVLPHVQVSELHEVFVLK